MLRKLPAVAIRIGFALAFRKVRAYLVPILAPFLIQTGVSMAFVSGVRYRGFLEPLLVIFAGYLRPFGGLPAREE